MVKINIKGIMKKKILITGSTDGVGKLLALQLAEEGHDLCVHGRDAFKVKNLVSELKAITHHNEIKGYVADFSDVKAVKKMASKVVSEHSKLDVLINNAGVFNGSETSNTNQIDLRLVVNYLAAYVLTESLMVLLQKSESPRVVNLSSAAQASVSIEALAGTKALGVSEAYAQSKLALTMYGFYLAKKEPWLGVVAVNPGSLLNTKMAHEAYGQYWSPAEKGVAIVRQLALEYSKEEIQGKYFDNDQGEFTKAHSDSYKESLVLNLINQTKKIVNI